MKYTVFIEEAAVDAIQATRGIQRRDLKEFIRLLGSNPFDKGDFPENDETGRTVFTKVIGAHAVTFWADHAVKEVKVFDVLKADE